MLLVYVPTRLSCFIHPVFIIRGPFIIATPDNAYFRAQADRREIFYEERARLKSTAWLAEGEAAASPPSSSLCMQPSAGSPSPFSESVGTPDPTGADVLTLFQAPVGHRHSDGSGSCYLFRLDDDFIVDATDCGSAARFVNHCCEPNCYSRVITVDGEKHIVIMALRDLPRGDELTYHYKFAIESDPALKIPCYCGAVSCCGTMN